MKLGKVPESIYKRGNFRKYGIKRNIGTIDLREPCQDKKKKMIYVSETLYGYHIGLAFYAVTAAINKVLSQKAVPTEVGLSIVLPSRYTEQKLQKMIEHITRASNAHTVKVAFVEAEVSPLLKSIMIHVIGVGEKENRVEKESTQYMEEASIVMTKAAGTQGMLQILEEKKEELLTHFHSGFVEQAAMRKEELFINTEIACAMQDEEIDIQPVCAGGIFEALWTLSERQNMGLEIAIEKIAVRQETIEICEYFRLNPYRLASSGTTLFVTRKADVFLEELHMRGVSGEVIGKLTKGNDKIILRGIEKSSLEKPCTDELLKLYT